MVNIKTTVNETQGVVSDKISNTEEARMRVNIPTNLRSLTVVNGSTILEFPIVDGTPNQILSTDGSGSLNLQDLVYNVTASLSSSILPIISNFVVFADAISGSFTLTLPDAISTVGKQFHVKKIDNTGNTVTIQPSGSQVIDNASNKVITTPYTSINLVSYSNNWWIV